MTAADDRFAIIAALDRYAECLDRREWDGLGDVFCDDLEADYQLWQAESIPDLCERIRSMLGGCGPTQHLLGNYRIELDGDRAASRCYARVMHFAADGSDRSFEVWMEYADAWRRTPAGWRSHSRRATVSMQRGDPSVLGPEQ